MAAEFPCETITWERFHTLARRLSERIKSSGYRPDVVIAIARGGYVPARVVCDFLLQNQLTGIQVEHYRPGAAKNATARVTSPLPIDIAGLRALVVDDLTDTGDTFLVVMEYISQFGPKEVRTAVLQHKSSSVFRPDYYAEYLSRKRWIIYPWAIHEDLFGFIRKIIGEKEYSLRGIRKELMSRYRIDAQEREIRAALDDLLARNTAVRTGSRYRGV